MLSFKDRFNFLLKKYSNVACKFYNVLFKGEVFKILEDICLNKNKIHSKMLIDHTTNMCLVN
jgi:hypothetical protein